MANAKFDGRQWPLVAATPLLGIANLGTGLGVDIVIPAGAYVREVYADTITAFNSGTTATITVTDGTIVYVNAQDLKSVGRETAAVSGAYYPAGGVISVNLAQTGTAGTLGAALVSIEYVVLNRANEVQQ